MKKRCWKSDSCSSLNSIQDSICEAIQRWNRRGKPWQRKIHWAWIFPFILFWIALYYFVVVIYSNKLPAALTIANATNNPNCFIAERAQLLLSEYEAIGPKVAGSYANEKLAIDFLLNEIIEIKRVMNNGLFTMEYDVQQASGAYVFWEMVNMYQGIQNVIVKLTTKNKDSSSYLLINTHFDSRAESPGYGDPGAMCAVMLEVIRVLATGNIPFTHPIVFLFNGSKRNSLQGSHGFMTNHQWAPKCKAFINLDSAGSGNRDIVLQSSPSSPWIMKYYKQYAAHPFANTAAEALFQLNMIPTETDFKIFQKFGSLPGLDMSHIYSGNVYNTKYDKGNLISCATLQNTGENVLALAKAFANAGELDNPSNYPSGETIFYDLLGKHMVSYSTSLAAKINYGLAIAAFVAIFFSLKYIGHSSKAAFLGVCGRFVLTLVVHMFGIVVGIGIVIFIGEGLDKLGLSLSWFTLKWMVLGLYFCPLIFGMGYPTALLISLTMKDKVSLSFRVQLILNAQLALMALLTVALTYYGIKLAYLFMLATAGYTFALLLITVTTLYRRGFAWFYVVIIVQIPAFVFFAYLGSIFLKAFVPMMGRFGSAANPELYIAGLSVTTCLLSLGFLIPLVNLFEKSKTVFLSILVVTVASICIAISPLGYPFQSDAHVEQFSVMHVRRVFREFNNTVSRNESGFYFHLEDRRGLQSISNILDISTVVSLDTQCSQYMFCGLPVYNHRWNKDKALTKWLPSVNVELPAVPKLTLITKVFDNAFSTVRYEFTLDGPPHMGISIGPLAGSNVTDWSFVKDMLVNNWKPPYFIYFTKAKDQSTLRFYVKFQKTKETLVLPTFELGIGGHYISNEYVRGVQTKAFFQSFPANSYIMQWPSSYEKRIY